TKKEAEKIYPYITGEIGIETDQNLELSFQIMKDKVIFGKEFVPADYEYWKKHGMLTINSFTELLKKSR
ncbi:MAG: hypothetical protein GY870_03640, partial [archaeon]|nr:hypothetical protein [archaeon]